MDLCQIFKQPFSRVLELAHEVHQEHHSIGSINLYSALSIKSGGCPEDCSFCPQSAHYKTGVQRTNVMNVNEAIAFASRMKDYGSIKMCLGGAWRGAPNGESWEKVLEIVAGVNALGLKVCCSMSLVSLKKAIQLKKAGCYEYNHNFDTSRRFYHNVITTRIYENRLESLHNIRESGLKVSSGGIIGMGENVEDRVDLIYELSQLSPIPETIILNALQSIDGTPLEGREPVNPFDFVKVVALARVAMPHADIVLSAGRPHMSQEMQALCFYAGATSMYTGAKILTVQNPTHDEDKDFLGQLNLEIAI